MALTNDDKQWIKGAIADGVVEALEAVVLPRFDEHGERILKQDVSALKQDVIYAVIYKKPNRALVSKNFEKLSTEDKITIMHEELLKIAKHENVTLA